MNIEEAKSCIGTIEMLQRLAYNIHGVMDVIDADNCKKIIKALEQEPCEDAVSRSDVISMIMNLNLKHIHSFSRGISQKAFEDLLNGTQALPSVTPIQKKGKWIKRHTEEKYDFFGNRVKVAAYKCSVCGRIIEDIGTYGVTNRIENYPYCHCGSKNEVEE